MTFVENGTFKVKTYYDDEENEVKTILTNSNVRFASTASANGKTLSTNYPLVFITRGDDADIRVGLRNAYHVPGAGVVLLDAGRLILDVETGDVIFEAGQHELLERVGRRFLRLLPVVDIQGRPLQRGAANGPSPPRGHLDKHLGRSGPTRSSGWGERVQLAFRARARVARGTCPGRHRLVSSSSRYQGTPRYGARWGSLAKRSHRPR